MGQLISAAILVTFVGSALVYGAHSDPDASMGNTESMTPGEWEVIEQDTHMRTDTTGCAYNHAVRHVGLIGSE